MTALPKMKELIKQTKSMVKSVLGKKERKEVQTPAITKASNRERYLGLNMLFFVLKLRFKFLLGNHVPNCFSIIRFYAHFRTFALYKKYHGIKSLKCHLSR